MKNGIPFDVAFSLPADERLDLVVIFGEFEGNVFDWASMRWLTKEERSG